MIEQTLELSNASNPAATRDPTTIELQSSVSDSSFSKMVSHISSRSHRNEPFLAPPEFDARIEQLKGAGEQYQWLALGMTE
jgi:hypothetical protein